MKANPMNRNPARCLPTAAWVLLFAFGPMFGLRAAPVLSGGCAAPLNGNLETPFTFEVTLTDPTNAAAPAVSVVLDETTTLPMTAVSGNSTAAGQVFRWTGTLPKARHRFRFAASGATGDIAHHLGPIVSDQPLTFRKRIFSLGEIGFRARVVPVGDINGDGIPDLLTNVGGLRVLLGPNYFWHEGYVIALPAGYLPQSMRGLGDVDGDGIGDFAVGSTSVETAQDNIAGADDNTPLRVYRGQLNAPPVLWKSFPRESLPRDFSPGCGAGGIDIDRDGHPDLVSVAYEVRHYFNGIPNWTMVVVTRYGPDFSRVVRNNLGAGPETTISPTNNILFTDVDGDGYLDLLALINTGTLVQDEAHPSNWNYPTAGTDGRLVVHGPNMSDAYITPHPGVNLFYGTVGLGDYNGDGADEFFTGGKLVTSSNLASGTPFPAPITDRSIFSIGGGDVTGSGAHTMVNFDSGNMTVFSKTAAGLFQVVATAPLYFSMTWSDTDTYAYGWLGDVDGNGLADFYSCNLWTSPPNWTATNPATIPWPPLGVAGRGEIIMPVYPYPMTPADLPAHFRGRARDLGIEYTFWGMTQRVGLMPDGTLDLKVGPPQADGRARIILLADTFHMPNTPNGETLYRIEAAGKDGSGWITVNGTNAGQVSLEMDLKVTMTNSEGVFTDTVHVAFATQQPMDFNTGLLQLLGNGKMPQFFVSYGAGTTMKLRLDAYVDYVQPESLPSLVRLPATLRFPTQNAGAAENIQKVWLCNMGGSDLRIDAITAPAAPFRITTMPSSFPITLAAGATLELPVGFSPAATGRYDGQITIRSNDATTSNQTVTLLGFGIPAGETDSDNDGMPDSYEARYATATSTYSLWGLSANEDDSSMDFDRDGLTNLAEYYAGTDATNPNDPAGSPLINVGVTQLPAFATAVGTPSSEAWFVVSGIRLSGNITVTPPNGCELTTDMGSNPTYTKNALTLPSMDGVVNMIVMARMTGASAGSFAGAITLSSPGAANKEVQVFGTVGTAFQIWKQERFGSPDNAGDGADLNDFDHDGMPNLLEYAFGKNPKAAEAHGIAPNVSGNKMQISFLCDSTRTDITYTVQASGSLAAGGWTDIATSVGGGMTVPVESLSTVSDSGTGLRTVTVTEAAAFAGGKRFLRVKVTSP